MNAVCILRSRCFGISEQPAQLSEAPTASDPERGKLPSKTPCSRGGRAAPSLAKLSSTPRERQTKRVLGRDPPSSPPSQSRRGKMPAATQPAHRACHALQAAACRARSGQAGRAPRSRRTIPGVLTAGKSHRSQKKPSQPSSPSRSPSCYPWQGCAGWLPSRCCSQRGLSSSAFHFQKGKKVQV